MLKSKIAPNYVDLAPPYAGLLHGLCDTLQSCAGFIIPVWSHPSNFRPKYRVLNSDSDYDGSGHKWKLNDDQRLVTILVHYCTDPNSFIFVQIRGEITCDFPNIFRKWPYLDQYIFAGTTGAGALVYLILASAEPQPSIIGGIETESDEVEKDIHGDNKYVKEPLRN